VALARQIVGHALSFGQVMLTDDNDAGASLPKTAGRSSADTSGSAQNNRDLP